MRVMKFNYEIYAYTIYAANIQIIKNYCGPHWAYTFCACENMKTLFQLYSWRE